MWFLKTLCLITTRPVLFDVKTVYRKQMLFENKKHEVYMVNKHKIALNRDNGKRLVQGDEITTLSRGYIGLLV